MTSTLNAVAALSARDQVIAGIVAVAAFALVIVVARALVRQLRKYPAADLLTFANAAVATAVAMTGTWVVAGKYLHFTGLERVALFSVLELTVLRCATQARENIRVTGSAGADGIAIWVVSAASGVAAAWATGFSPGGLVRFGVPMLAAWLWDRGLCSERRKYSGEKTKNWLRTKVEQQFTRWGWLEPEQHDFTEAVIRARIARLAATVARCREDRPGRKGRRDRRRLRVLLLAAVDAGLAEDDEQQALFDAQLGALLGAEGLLGYTPGAPWSPKRDALRARGTAGARPGVMTGARGGASGSHDREHDAGDAREHDASMTEPMTGDRSGAAVKLRAGHGKSAAELVPHVLARLDAGLSVSQPDVKAALHVGTGKAAEAIRLALLQRENEADGTITPIGRATAEG